jgi:hypothetical protein
MAEVNEDITAVHAQDEDQNTFATVIWDEFLRSIEEEKCVICVGPGIYTENGVSLEKQLFEHLKPFERTLKIQVYEDGWLQYDPSNYNMVTFRYQLKQFFNKPFPTADRIFEKLAQIPFHLYVSVTFDRKLDTAFQGYDHHFDFYDKNHPVDEKTTEEPIKECPLVYNMFGDLEKVESLVLTQDEHYKFLKSIFREQSMSSKYRSALESADHFIFLGIPFEKWYMQLFLRILGQHQNKDKQKYAPDNVTLEELQRICEEQFNITFINSDIEGFVTRLFKKFRPDQLRKKSSRPQEFPAADIESMIRDARIDEAFEIFLDALKFHRSACKEVLEKANNLWRNFKEQKDRWSVQGVISNDEYNRELNKIALGLQALINDAKACLKKQ